MAQHVSRARKFSLGGRTTLTPRQVGSGGTPQYFWGGILLRRNGFHALNMVAAQRFYHGQSIVSLLVSISSLLAGARWSIPPEPPSATTARITEIIAHGKVCHQLWLRPLVRPHPGSIERTNGAKRPSADVVCCRTADDNRFGYGAWVRPRINSTMQRSQQHHSSSEASGWQDLNLRPLDLQTNAGSSHMCVSVSVLAGQTVLWTSANSRETPKNRNPLRYLLRYQPKMRPCLVAAHTR